MGFSKSKRSSWKLILLDNKLLACFHKIVATFILIEKLEFSFPTLNCPPTLKSLSPIFKLPGAMVNACLSLLKLIFNLPFNCLSFMKLPCFVLNAKLLAKVSSFKSAFHPSETKSILPFKSSIWKLKSLLRL